MEALKGNAGRALLARVQALEAVAEAAKEYVDLRFKLAAHPAPIGGDKSGVSRQVTDAWLRLGNSVARLEESQGGVEHA